MNPISPPLQRLFPVRLPYKEDQPINQLIKDAKPQLVNQLSGNVTSIIQLKPAARFRPQSPASRSFAVQRSRVPVVHAAPTSTPSVAKATDYRNSFELRNLHHLTLRLPCIKY